MSSEGQRVLWRHLHFLFNNRGVQANLHAPQLIPRDTYHLLPATGRNNHVFKVPKILQSGNQNCISSSYHATKNINEELDWVKTCCNKVSKLDKWLATLWYSSAPPRIRSLGFSNFEVIRRCATFFLQTTPLTTVLVNSIKENFVSTRKIKYQYLYSMTNDLMEKWRNNGRNQVKESFNRTAKFRWKN